MSEQFKLSQSPQDITDNRSDLSDEQKPESSGSKSVRVSQRAPTSCSSCYRLKTKCSKVFPCLQCIRRGKADSCSREPVIVRGNLVGGIKEVEKRPLTPQELELENKALKRKLATLQRECTQLREALPPDMRRKKSDGAPSLYGTLQPPDADADTGINDITSLEDKGNVQQTLRHQVEAQIYASDLDAVGMLHWPSGEEDYHWIGQGLAWKKRSAENAAETKQALLALVPVQISSLLVRACLRYLAWCHCVIDVPDFIRTHDAWMERFVAGDKDVSNAFLALYFAVVSISVHYLGDTVLSTHLAFPREIILLMPRIWFEASLEALSLSDYMARTNTDAPAELAIIQTICLIPLVAHSFGASRHLLFLLHAAIKMSMRHNFHLLTAESAAAAPGWRQRELGRRIWARLFVEEALSPVAHQPGAVFHTLAATSPPLNMDDSFGAAAFAAGEFGNSDIAVSSEPTLDDTSKNDTTGTLPTPKALPLAVPTDLSDLLAKVKLAAFSRRMRQRLDGAADLKAQYNIIVESDAELAHILDDFPQLVFREDEDYSTCGLDKPYELDTPKGGLDHFDYLPWARFEWSIALKGWRRIVLYRPFLARAYSDDTFRAARKCCIESARHVLKLRQRVTPPLFQKSWNLNLNTVLSGVILGTELCYGSGSPDEKRRLKHDITALIDILPRGGDSILVKQGVLLLRRMLDEADGAHRAPVTSTLAPPPLTQSIPTPFTGSIQSIRRAHDEEKRPKRGRPRNDARRGGMPARGHTRNGGDSVWGDERASVDGVSAKRSGEELAREQTKLPRGESLHTDNSSSVKFEGNAGPNSAITGPGIGEHRPNRDVAVSADLVGLTDQPLPVHINPLPAVEAIWPTTAMYPVGTGAAPSDSPAMGPWSNYHLDCAVLGDGMTTSMSETTQNIPHANESEDLSWVLGGITNDMSAFAELPSEYTPPFHTNGWPKWM